MTRVIVSSIARAVAASQHVGAWPGGLEAVCKQESLALAAACTHTASALHVHCMCSAHEVHMQCIKRPAIIKIIAGRFNRLAPVKPRFNLG